MEKIANKMNTLWGAAVALFASTFGEFWFLFVAFFVLNIVDYITGVAKARFSKKENSNKGLKGIIKKVGYWVVIDIAFFIALSFEEMGTNIGINLAFVEMLGWFTLATFIINEIRSILENLVILGVDVPVFLTKGLEVAAAAVQSKTENITEDKKRMKILLIAGHGNGDPGACACGLKEADLTREVAAALLPKLKAYADVDLFDTSKNMYSYLKNGGVCNFANYDYVFEIHFNAAAADAAGNGKTTGAEILIHTTESGASVEEAILSNITALGFKNRGVKRCSDLRNMNVCKKNYGVSYALIEVCFIDDRDDVNLYQQKKAEVIDAIVNGIASGFGLAKTETAAAGFKDAKGHYAEAAINDLFKMGIVNGDGNGNFRPDDNIKRGDAAIMVRNAIRYITGK